MDEIHEVLDKIEKIIKNDNPEPDEGKTDSGDQPSSHSTKDIIYLIIDFFLNTLKAPFKIIAKYLRNEIVEAVKKDAKLYALIMGIMGVLFVFFSVIWLFISVAVGVYFYEKGNSILISIVYSILFQLISFILVSLIALLASKKTESLKMLNNIKESTKQQG